MPSRIPKVRPTCSMVSILLIGLPMRSTGDRGTAACDEAFSRSRLQPFMHDKELTIFAGIEII